MEHLSTNSRMTEHLAGPRGHAGFVSIEHVVFGTTLVVIAFAIALGVGAKALLAFFGLPVSG